MQNKSTIGYLTKQYKSILKKCFLISVGAYALLGAGFAKAGDFEDDRAAGGDRTYTMSGDYTLDASSNIEFFYSSGTFTIIGNLVDATTYDPTSTDDVYEFIGSATGNDTSILARNNSGVLNIENVVMKSGQSSYGGGFFNATGSASVKNSAFVDNHAFSNGGAISTANLTVENSSFIDNTAVGDGGAISNGNNYVTLTNTLFKGNSAGDGGAIANRGNLTISGSTFNSNSATVNGGAIYQYSNGTTTPAIVTDITNSSFNANQAKLGGAIYIAAGELLVSGGSFTSNIASSNNSDISAGGAIYNLSKNLNINTVTFEYNGVTGSKEASAEVGGGAIYNAVNAKASISNSIFKGNYVKEAAVNNGGAIINSGEMSILNSTFDANYAQGTSVRGGVLRNNASGVISEISGTFSNNFAKGLSGDSAYSGAIHNMGTITKLSGDFTSNYASHSAGGAYGGAISNFGNISIVDSDFTGNYVSNSISASAGGAIFNAVGATLTIDKTDFTANKRLGVTGDYASGTGGGAIANQGTATISNAILKDNTSLQRGGAIHNYLGDITINTSTFDSNSSEWGGALYVGGKADGSIIGEAKITGSYFNNNSATAGGGAIYVSVYSDVTIKDTNFDKNSSVTGGAIYHHYDTSTLKIEGGTFSNNTATNGNGGAINSVGELTIIGTIFKNNKAQPTSITGNVQGGALRLNAKTTITGATFDGNSVITTTAAAQGGAILNNGETTITDSVIKNSLAQGDTGNGRGGAIENSSGQKLTITNTSFINNKAIGKSVYGGAIYNTGILYLNATGGKNTVFSGNLEGSTSNAIQSTSNVYFNSDDDSQIIFYDGIRGTGTYHLESGNLSLLGANANFASGTNLNVSGGKISTIDDVIRTTNLGDLVLTADVYYGLDVNLENGTGDSIKTQSFDADGHNIIINELNVIKDGNLDVTLSNDAAIRSAILLDADAIVSKIASVEKDYNVISYNTTTGVLDFIEDNLKGAVNSDETQRIYTMSENEIVEESIGNMGGSILDVSGLNADGENFEIIASPTGLEGITTFAGQTLNISDVSKVSGFETTGNGGFINNAATLNIDNVTFEDNHGKTITSTGGVINSNVGGSLNIENSVFNNNTTQFAGGAVAVFGGAVKNVFADFTGNATISTGRALAGAIYLNTSAESIVGTFTNNYVTSSGGYDVVGGAIAIMTGTIKNLTATFSGNYVNSTGSAYAGGGALRNFAGATVNITDSEFVGNYAQSNNTLSAGGAIFSHGNGTIGANLNTTNGAKTNVSDSNFFDNYAKTNTGTAQGGAVYLETISDILTVKAENEDVYFSGNYTDNGGNIDFNAVHLNAGKMSLVTTGDNQIIFNDAITSEKIENTINIAGSVVFNDVVSNASILLNSGNIDINQYNTYNEEGYTGVGAHELEFNTNIFNNVNLTMASNTSLNAVNNKATDDLNFNTLTLNGNANISIDADLQSGDVDTINATTVAGSGSLIIDSVNLISDSSAKSVELDITDTDDLAAKISIVGTEILKSSGVFGLYNIAGYNNTTGVLTIGRLSLAETVQLNANDKVYTFFEDEEVAEDLGTLAGNSLDIIGTGNDYIIDGKGFGGITVEAGRTLSITDVDNVTGFVSASMGGVIINSGTTKISGTTFTNNSAAYAGGVIRNDGGNITITDSIFTNNFGGSAGSAILSNTGTVSITGSTLSNNTKNTIGNVGTVNIFGSTFANNESDITTTNYTGGAINNYGLGTLNINKASTLTTLFEKNKGVAGGAISNASDQASVINNATFSGNSAQKGGAIYNTGLIASITNSVFNNNKSVLTSGDSFGGAINNTAGKITTISATFNNNYVEGDDFAHGGGIYNAGGSSIGSIEGKFEGNSVYAQTNSSAGGAIFNRDQITSIEANFIDNTSTTDGRAFGGAIYNTKSYSVGVNSIGSITGSFSGNKTDGGTESRGGAIWNSGVISKITGDFDSNSSSASAGVAEGGAILNSGTINLFDSSFTNNSVIGTTSADGGAIYNSGTLSITASTEDITFSGNTANGVSNAIYNTGTINFATTGDNKITSYDGFSGNGTYNLAGNLYLLGENANFESDSKLVISANSMINTIDNETRETNLGDVTLEADTKWGFDVDLGAKESDVVLGIPTTNSHGIILSELNLLSSLTDVPTLIEVIADDALALESYLSDDVVITAGIIPSEGVLVEYLKDSGELSFNLESLNAAFSVDVDEKAYMLGSDEASRTATANLGALVGTSLSISGNGLSILGGGFGGASVADGQTLTFNDVSSVDGFVGNAVTNSGELNVVAANYDSTWGVGADIYNNNATINLKTQDDNTITLNNNIDGVSGDIIIEGDVIANANIFNNDISLKSGSLSLGQTAALNNVDLIAGGGALNLANGKTQDTNFNFISLNNSSLDVSLDVDLENSVADRIVANDVSSLSDNKINIKDLYIISDAVEIETTVNIANNSTKGYINFNGVNIHDDGLLEDYNTGYLIGYSTTTGNITFSFATLETAFSSSVETKAYAMVEADEGITTALVLNGSSLDIDGNGFEINASDINVNGKELGIADVILNSTLSGSGSVSFDRDVTINSDVSGFEGDVNLNGGTLSLTENATFFADNTLNISNTPTLNLQNGGMDILNAQNWNMSSNLNVMIDVDLVGKAADSIIGYDNEDNAINISSIFLTSEKQGQTTVSVTDELGGGNFTISSDQLKIVDEIYEYQYNVDSSKLASDGYLTFVDTEYKDFNPAIVDSIVAKQSQYLSSISVYKEAFANFGTQSPLPYRNLASGDENKIDAIWFRPFGKNEDVNLDNGYSVDNEAYGALFGVDSPMKFYDNCWSALYSVYGGYINSTQKYDDVKIEQDGFVIGYRALFERQNFFSGITANISTSFADGNNMFGKEDFAMYSTGVASKTGYNFGFEDKSFILQPSLMLSYTYIHTPSYDNSSDVKISKQNLHALQITPELKFIKNLDNNRQVYFGANYNWNLIDASDVTANDVVLPNIAVDPYAEFRLGTSRKFDDEIETFVEVTASTGGREGVGIEAGIKIEF